MLNSNETAGVVLAAAGAAGNAVVTRPRDAFRHLFLVTMTAAGNVWVEASVGTTGRWVRICDVVTTTDYIAVEGTFSNLRVVWSANAGLITVDLIQSALIPDVY